MNDHSDPLSPTKVTPEIRMKEMEIETKSIDRASQGNGQIEHPSKYMTGFNRKFTQNQINSLVNTVEEKEQEMPSNNDKFGVSRNGPRNIKNGPSSQRGFLNNKKETSKTELYVSDFTVENAQKALNDHFSQFGKVDRVALRNKLNSTDTYAHVAMSNEEDARKAVNATHSEIGHEAKVKYRYINTFKSSSSQQHHPRGRGSNSSSGSNRKYGNHGQYGSNMPQSVSVASPQNDLVFN